MRAMLLALALCAVCTGCASVPLAGKSSKGEKFMGQATVTPTGGTFSATSLDGVTISGTYNPWEFKKALPVKFTSSDGRTGTAIILRDETGASGMGSGKSTDGTTYEFFMGKSIRQYQSEW